MLVECKQTQAPPSPRFNFNPDRQMMKFPWWMVLFAHPCFSARPVCSIEKPCKVIVDQDCGHAADTNLNSVLALLLDPKVTVLGVTVVYGTSLLLFGLALTNRSHCRRFLADDELGALLSAS
jgi:hypothetical protein